MLLNNQQITEEIKKEIKICIETNENENNPKPMVSESCTFLRICPFLPSCPFYWHIVADSSLL